MISVDEALERIVGTVPVMPVEQIALADGLGRVLAEDIAARRTQPPTAVSAMDGYAVHAEDVQDLPATLEVIGAAPAGEAYPGTLRPGQAVRIFTGGPVPDGADAIVIQENTTTEASTVTVIEGKTTVGRYVRPAGLDFTEGQTLLSPGRALTARDIGLAAGMNVPWIKVRRKPLIALLATGDEIVMPGDPIGPHQIVSSNGLALSAFITAAGGRPIDLGISPDSRDALKAMAAGARGADMLVTTGGASVGDHDIVQSVLGEVGLELDFWKIAMRPGKPLIFGRIAETPILGLPGNPVSALVCALIYLGPAIRAMLGLGDGGAPTASAILGRDLTANDERQDYLRSRLEPGPGGTMVATPSEAQDSSMFATLAHAQCLIVRAPHAPPAKAGDVVTILPLQGGIVSI
jgi:molybdopterin molybdotransferase